MALLGGQGLFLRLHDLDPARRLRLYRQSRSVGAGFRAGGDRESPDRTPVPDRRAYGDDRIPADDEAAGCPYPQRQSPPGRLDGGADLLSAVYPDGRRRAAQLPSGHLGLGFLAGGPWSGAVDLGQLAGVPDRDLRLGDGDFRHPLFQPHLSRDHHQRALPLHPPSGIPVEEPVLVVCDHAVPRHQRFGCRCDPQHRIARAGERGLLLAGEDRGAPPWRRGCEIPRLFRLDGAPCADHPGPVADRRSAAPGADRSCSLRSSYERELRNSLRRPAQYSRPTRHGTCRAGAGPGPCRCARSRGAGRGSRFRCRRPH